MGSVLIRIALIVLLASPLSYAQHDTPMEVLINIANAEERFISTPVFIEDDREAAYLETYLKDYSLLKLNIPLLSSLMEKEEEFITISLPSPKGGTFEMNLVNFDIRSEDFAIYEKVGESKVKIESPDALFYRGVLNRGTDSHAGFSFFEDRVYGLFGTLEHGNIILALDPINPGKNGENYIVYLESDMDFERSMKCNSDKLDLFEDYSDVSRSNVYETCEDIDVEVEATYKLFLQKGGSTSTSNYISAFFNNVSILYRNENIYTSLKNIIINTSPDDYGSLNGSSAKLNKYAENVQNTYQSAGAELAHLVDYNEPGLGGIAWINAMCVNYAFYSSINSHYGAYAYSSIEDTYQEFPDFSMTVFMFTHEMGHNLGSRHTQSCSWEGGPIDNCAAVENGDCSPGPAPTNGGTIMSYCHTQASVGINFSLGFGELPGNKIRSLTKQKTCTETYIPSEYVVSNPTQTITANRECTTADGWTYYYNDNNSASTSDDELLLAVRKDGEDIGNLDDGTLVVQIKTSSNAGSGSTHINDPGYDVGDDWHVMNRWFELYPTNEPSNPVTVRFPYTDQDYNDVLANQATVSSHKDLIFYKINNPGDPNPDNGHSSVSNGDILFYENANSSSLTEWKYINDGNGRHIAEFQVSSFSGGGGGFSEQSSSVVPVELMTYKASKEYGNAVLEWATSSEVNNDFFTIERSGDGKNFEPIGKLKGMGESYTVNEYKFIDRAPLKGINYYRLIQHDFNGQISDLGTRSLLFESTIDVQIFPNPNRTNVLNVNLEITGANKEYSIQITDLSGRLVHNSSLGLHADKTVDISDLLAGMYMVKIQNGSDSSVHKLIKE